MNLKFRKKPIVVEAFQMTLERRLDNSEWPEWLHRAWNEDYGRVGSLQRTRPFDRSDSDELEIVTLEGVRLVSFGDWIIRGIKGELYPCKPDIFEATYELEYAEPVTSGFTALFGGVPGEPPLSRKEVHRVGEVLAILESLVDQIIDGLNHEDFSGEPINWGDLSCVGADLCCSGNEVFFQVMIEECDSPKLCQFVAAELSKLGYPDVSVCSRW